MGSVPNSFHCGDFAAVDQCVSVSPSYLTASVIYIFEDKLMQMTEDHFPANQLLVHFTRFFPLSFSLHWQPEGGREQLLNSCANKHVYLGVFSL